MTPLRDTLQQALEHHQAGRLAEAEALYRWCCAASRALLDFCGLSWHEGCLSFHRTERVVQTASKLQVRQPIHKRSVGRWAPFQAHLEPLRLALGLVPRTNHQPTDTVSNTLEVEKCSTIR